MPRKKKKKWGTRVGKQCGGDHGTNYTEELRAKISKATLAGLAKRTVEQRQLEGQRKSIKWRKWRVAQTFGQARMNKMDRKYLGYLAAIYNVWMTDKTIHLEHKRLEYDPNFIITTWEKHVQRRNHDIA